MDLFDILNSKAKSKIMRVFSERPLRRWYKKELAVECNISQTAVANALKELVKQKVAEEHINLYLKCYCLNENEWKVMRDTT